MQTISVVPADVARLKQVLAAFGRRRSLRDPMAAACEELDLTPAQIHTLLWLKTDGPLTMGEIARRVSSEKTVTGIVDRLVRMRLVQREHSVSDRRVIRCQLTRSGERVAEKLDEAVSHAMHSLLSMLEREDRHHLVRILETLQQRMERAAA
jgi:DNA-binding MarR family transcriptional regulator